MYESPITICMKQIRMTQDKTIVRAVQDVGIFVNKDELIKALQYDREQYEKGYSDGLEAAKRELTDKIASFLEQDGNWEALKACCCIDDRAICFNGPPETLLSKIKMFEPWNKKAPTRRTINAITDSELLDEVRTYIQSHDFWIRGLVMELARRYELRLTAPPKEDA